MPQQHLASAAAAHTTQPEAAEVAAKWAAAAARDEQVEAEGGMHARVVMTEGRMEAEERKVRTKDAQHS